MTSRERRFAILAGIVLGSVLIAWFCSQQIGPAPAPKAADTKLGHSPEPGAPSASPVARALIQPGSVPRAQSRSSPAEVRSRFTHDHECFAAQRYLTWLADGGWEKAEAMGIAQQDREYLFRSRAFSEALVSRVWEGCDRSEDARATFSAASLRAAEAGDSMAAECYIVHMPVDLPAPDLFPQRQLSDAEKAAWKTWIANSRRLIANGLARGDWRMAVAAMNAASPREYQGIDDHGDPTTVYRMTRLLQNGLLDARDRDAMKRSADAQAEQLTRGQLEKADAWVARNLPRFAATPPIPYDLMCTLPGQPAPPRPRY